METTDLRTEFTKETKTRFNTEWLAYNDYVDWLEQRLVKLLTIPPVSGSFPSDSEIETAALTYRDKSDNENTNEDTMMIDVHWYDKQEAFTAGVKWFLENYR